MFLSVFALRKLLCWRLANGSWLCESSRWGTAGAVSQLWQGIAIQPRPRDANSLQRRFWIKEDLKWIKLIKEHQVISSHIKSIQVCLILYFFLSNLKVTLWGLDAPTANVVLRGLRSHWRQALSFAVCHKQRDPLAGRKALRSLRFSFKWSEMFLLISLNFFLNNVSFLILSCLSSLVLLFLLRSSPASLRPSAAVVAGSFQWHGSPPGEAESQPWLQSMAATKHVWSLEVLVANAFNRAYLIIFNHI